MRPVDFWLAGAQKSGTTSLFAWLSQHPDIFLPEAKEVHFFARDEFWSQGARYLEPFYADADGQRLLGGAYVHDLFLGTAARMKSYNPKILVVVALREPGARAWSAYWFARRNGWENAETFEAALDLEAGRAASGGQARTELTYLAHGHYAEQLRPFLDVLGRHAVRVVFTDDLHADPAGALAGVLDWLGLAPTHAIDTGHRANRSSMPRSPRLQGWLLRESRAKAAIRRLTTPGQRWRFRRAVLRPILRRNTVPFQYPAMDPRTRSRLDAYFAAHNAALREVVGPLPPGWT